MLIDAYNAFSIDQSLPADTNAADSTNKIDLGSGLTEFRAAAIPDYSKGEPLYLYIQMTVAATSAGAMTTTIALHDSADNSSFSAVTTPISSVAKATLVQGYQVRTLLPASLRRYLKLVVQNGTAGATAGKFTAWIAPE